jgi:hypothetical protein
MRSFDTGYVLYKRVFELDNSTTALLRKKNIQKTIVEIT